MVSSPTPEGVPEASSSDAPQDQAPTTASEVSGETPPAPAPVSSPRPKPSFSPRARKRLGWAVFWLIVAVTLWFTVVSGFISFRRSHALTDDAFVESHLVHLSSQTPGLIVRVLVEERDLVHAGQLLAEVDPELLC